jgi:hypothetical protein
MEAKRLMQAAAVAVALTAAWSVAGKAAGQFSDTNQLTYLTFSAPVELPGVTLPAGKYAFQLLDSPVNRHIVEVWDENRTRLITIALTVPSDRRQVSDETVVTFEERSEDAPPAVQYWYYPGTQSGHEFVYPHDQAVKIARASNHEVLSTDASGNDAESLRQGHLSRVNSRGESSEYAKRSGSESGSESNRAATTSQSGSESASGGRSSTSRPGDDTVASGITAQSGQAETPSASAGSQSGTSQAGTSQSGSAATSTTGSTEPGSTSTSAHTSGAGPTQSSTATDNTSGTPGHSTSAHASTTGTGARLPGTASNDSWLLVVALSAFVGLLAMRRTIGA